MTPLTSFILVTLAGICYAVGIVGQARAPKATTKTAMTHMFVSGAGVVLNLVAVLGFMVNAEPFATGSRAVHAILGIVALGMIVVLVMVGGALMRYKTKSGLYKSGEDDAFTRKVRRGLRKGGVVWAIVWLTAYFTGVGLYFGG